MKDRVFFLITALFTAIFLTMLISLAKADQRTIYGSDGRVIAREATTPSGTTTLYGADGRVITKESPTSGGTTIYGRDGRAIGKTDNRSKGK